MMMLCNGCGDGGGEGILAYCFANQVTWRFERKRAQSSYPAQEKWSISLCKQVQVL